MNLGGLTAQEPLSQQFLNRRTVEGIQIMACNPKRDLIQY